MRIVLIHLASIVVAFAGSFGLITILPPVIGFIAGFVWSFMVFATTETFVRPS